MVLRTWQTAQTVDSCVSLETSRIWCHRKGSYQQRDGVQQCTNRKGSRECIDPSSNSSYMRLLFHSRPRVSIREIQSNNKVSDNRANVWKAQILPFWNHETLKNRESWPMNFTTLDGKASTSGIIKKHCVKINMSALLKFVQFSVQGIHLCHLKLKSYWTFKTSPSGHILFVATQDFWRVFTSTLRAKEKEFYIQW